MTSDIMGYVSRSAGRRGSCIDALWHVRAPGAAGLQPLIEQGCATRGGWRTSLRVPHCTEFRCLAFLHIPGEPIVIILISTFLLDSLEIFIIAHYCLSFLVP